MRGDKRVYMLQVINLNLAIVFAEIEGAFAIFLAKSFGFVDLCILGKLSVCLEITCFIGGVLDNDIGLVILEVP